MREASVPEMLLTESEDGSADACTEVRAEERSRDETRDETHNLGESEETQDAGADAVDDEILPEGTMSESSVT
jgi:hypothetical protein